MKSIDFSPKSTTASVFGILSVLLLWLAETPSHAVDWEAASLTAKIRALRLFTSPIEWVGHDEPSESESLALLDASQAFETGDVKAGFDALEQFLARHPESSWTPSIRTHLAERYRVMGRYTAAMKHWERAWEKSRNETNETSRSVAARALTGWMKLLASVGHKEKVEALLREAELRGLFATPYAPLLYASREGLSVMKGKPGESYRCGSFALWQVMNASGANTASYRVVRETPSPDGGFNMAELIALGESNQFQVVAVQRIDGDGIPVPSVVHWKLDHFAAVVEEVEGRYRVVDPTFDGTAWMDARTINEEASGYFLVESKNVPAGWRRLTSVAAAAVRGKGFTYTADDESDNSGDDEEDDDCDPPEANDGPEGDGEPCPEGGMAVWRVSEPHMTLWVHDVPLYYRNSRGGWVKLRLSYKHRSVPRSDNIASFGANWECNWIGFLEQDSAQPSTIKNFLAGGGTIGFATNGTRDYWTGRRLNLYSSGAPIRILSAGGGGGGGGTSSSGRSGGADGFGADIADAMFLARLAAQSGSDNHYGHSNSYGAGLSRLFLTNRMDRYGRKVSFVWTNVTMGIQQVVQLQTMTDKDGKTCTLSYTNAAFPRLITSVQDPYGRYAHFKYDSSGRLTNITDMASMSSSFKYDSSGAMTNMVTPYGATSFKYFHEAGDPGFWSRGIEITEPTGEKQLSVYHDGYASGIWHHMQSYHWNRQQYAALSSGGKAGPLTNMVQADFDLAPRTEWLRTSQNSSSALLIGSPWFREPPGAVNQQTLRRSDYVRFTYPGQDYNVPTLMNRPVQIYWPNGDQIDLPRNDWGRPLEFRYLRNGQTVSFTNEYDGDGRRLEKVWGPNDELVRGYGYHATITNLLTSVTNALGEVMRYTHDAAIRVTSISNFNGLVTTNIFYHSGTYAGFLKTRIDIGFRTNHYTWVNGNVEWHTNELGLATKRTWDNLNRLTSILYPDSTTVSNVYNKLDLVGTKDRLNNWTYFGYNSLRQLVATTNANGGVTQWDYCGCGSPTLVTEWNGATPRYTQFSYNTAGRVTNAVFADGYTLNYEYDYMGRLTNVLDPAGLQLHFQYAEYDALRSLRLHSANHSGIVIGRSIDQYGRTSSETNRNAIVTTFQYDVLGRLTNRTVINSPDASVETFAWTPAGLFAHGDELSRTNWFVHDAAGRLLFQTNAENQILRFTYNPADQVLTLTDGRNQVTKWNYDPEGRLTNKVDQATVEIFRYKYDANHRLTNRWSLAKGDTFYRYDAIGNVTNIDYSGTVMDVALAYDGLDRLTNVVDAIGTTRFSYTAADQLLTEDGPWANDTVSYSYAHRRRTLLSLLQPNASPWTQSYAYDGLSRLTNIVSLAGTFGYGYLSGASDRIDYLHLPGHAAGATRYITNRYDSLARLTTTALYMPAGLVNRHAYEYNVAHQRTRQFFTADNFIDYTYDKIGQLKTAKGWESGGSTARAHEQFGYEYDASWNLQRRTNNALVQTFGNDSRNQVVSTSRSGTHTVAGKASLPGSSLNNVTVSGTGLSSGPAAVYADGSWARAGATLADGNNSYTATATDYTSPTPRTAQDSVTAYLPASRLFHYDGNGNLTNDGRRVFEYDYENQLTNVFVASAWRSEFKYDALGRRRIRREFTWQNGSWVLTNEIRYVYDRMLVVQERDAYNLALVSYTRGTDLSGGPQNAGGIGGLLARTDLSMLASGVVNAHGNYHADANGNVSAIVSTNGIVLARYHYDPYGNLLGMAGPLADANLYRFSSKEWHASSGLYYYGFRYYEPNLQRWINRDPIEEQGGLNLYQFVQNSPVDLVDKDGRILPAIIVGVIGYFGYTAIANAPGPDDEKFPAYKDAPDPLDCAFPGKAVANAARDLVGEQLGLMPPTGSEDTGRGKKKKHTPGRDHQTKSGEKKKERFQEKAAKKRADERQELEDAWDEWNKLSDEVKKLRPELKPTKPDPRCP